MVFPNARTSARYQSSDSISCGNGATGTQLLTLRLLSELVRRERNKNGCGGFVVFPLIFFCLAFEFGLGHCTPN